MQKHLEEEVSKTAAVVSDWKNSIAKIETQFNVAPSRWQRRKNLVRRKH
jgi:hypothetical protein